MPLVPQVLIDEVLKITDETNEDFLGFPLFFIDDDPDLGPDDERNLQTTADNWANAVGLYLSGLTAPPGAGGIASRAPGAGMGGGGDAAIPLRSHCAPVAVHGAGVLPTGRSGTACGRLPAAAAPARRRRASSCC